MMVPWRSLNGSHKSTYQCKKGADQKQQSLVAEESRTVNSRAFRAYGRTLEMVSSFKYLRRVLLVVDYDCPAVIQNLTKLREV